MKRNAALILTFAVVMVAAPSMAERFHDKPGAGTGGITAAVSPVKRLERAVVIEATELKAYLADIDRNAGTISISGLPPGKYDLLLKFDSIVAEGVSLNVPGAFKKLSKADLKGIQHRTWMSEPFFNKKRIARVGGTPKRIKMIVEQVRDKKTYEPNGNVLHGIMIRRLQLTELRKTGKIWQIKKNRHIFREERKMGGAGTRLKFIYVPRLGGIRIGDEVVKLPKIDLEKLKPKKEPHFYTASWKEK